MIAPYLAMITTLGWCCVLLMAARCVMGQDEPRRVPFDEALAAATNKVLPAYPLTARQLKIDGTVVIDADLQKDGSVYDTVILVGNPILTAAAQRGWSSHAPCSRAGKRCHLCASAGSDRL
jgi:hypothetical protein